MFRLISWHLLTCLTLVIQICLKQMSDVSVRTHIVQSIRYYGRPYGYLHFVLFFLTVATHILFDSIL